MFIHNSRNSVEKTVIVCTESQGNDPVLHHQGWSVRCYFGPEGAAVPNCHKWFVSPAHRVYKLSDVAFGCTTDMDVEDAAPDHSFPLCCCYTATTPFDLNLTPD